MAAHATFRSTVLLHGEESGGRVALVEVQVPPRWEGPPLHHHQFDEGFYVLDGELTFQVGDSLLAGGPGAFAFAPGGSVHTLANLGDEPARYLLIMTPAGFERYFEGREGAPETTVAGSRIADAAGAKRLTPPDERIKVLLTGAASGGRVAVMDNAVSGDVKGPPLHHHEFDEAFYVLDGELTFQLGEDVVPKRRGDLAFARGGAHHTFANRSGAEARQLIICTPAGFERYFQQMAAREAGVEPPPEALEPWPEVIKVGPQIGG